MILKSAVFFFGDIIDFCYKPYGVFWNGIIIFHFEDVSLFYAFQNIWRLLHYYKHFFCRCVPYFKLKKIWESADLKFDTVEFVRHFLFRPLQSSISASRHHQWLIPKANFFKTLSKSHPIMNLNNRSVKKIILIYWFTCSNKCLR